MVPTGRSWSKQNRLVLVELSLIESVQACSAQLGVRTIDSFRAAGFSDASWEPCDNGALIAMGSGRFVNRALGIGLGGTDPRVVLDQVEDFYLARGLTPCVEICPWAGSLLREMTSRGYVVDDIRDVYLHDLRELPPRPVLEVREVPDETGPGGALATAWVEILASGHQPESNEWKRDTEFFRIALCMPQRTNLVAMIDGSPCSTGSLSLVDSIGEFGGATTLASSRGRGGQQAVIAARLRRAKELGCKIAVAVAYPGTASSRNLQRNGFRLLFNSTLMRRP